MEPRVFRSGSTNIYENLAIEEMLFQRLGLGERALLLWKNTDAVVVGRYQNPYLECKVRAIARDGVSLARRQSGGGTVWHDLGNLCFTFMGSGAAFDRRANIVLVSEALRGLGVPADVNDRLDILAGGRKVSGSAFRESGGKSFHHGTILVDADLRRLAAYLSGEKDISHAKGIKSVGSEVGNLTQWNRTLSTDMVAEAVAETFQGGSRYELVHFDAALVQRRDELADPAWVFGACPPFVRRITLAGAEWELRIVGGKITDIHGDGEAPSKELSAALIGEDYGLLEEILPALQESVRL